MQIYYGKRTYKCTFRWRVLNLYSSKDREFPKRAHEVMSVRFFPHRLQMHSKTKVTHKHES